MRIVMKRKNLAFILKFLSGLLLVFCLSAPAGAQQPGNPMPQIGQAIGAGNASGVARYFGAFVDMNINGTQSTYSQNQGEMILRNFFEKNKADHFEAQRSTMENGGKSGFTIGTLKANTGSFKVYFRIREKDNNLQLQELRIER